MFEFIEKIGDYEIYKNDNRFDVFHSCGFSPIKSFEKIENAKKFISEK